MYGFLILVVVQFLLLEDDLREFLGKILRAWNFFERIGAGKFFERIASIWIIIWVILYYSVWVIGIVLFVYVWNPRLIHIVLITILLIAILFDTIRLIYFNKVFQRLCTELKYVGLSREEKELAIDIGTSNIRIVNGKGELLIDKPAVVAYFTSEKHNIFLTGVPYYAASFRPGTLEFVYPKKGGEIIDPYTYNYLINAMVEKAIEVQKVKRMEKLKAKFKFRRKSNRKA